MIESEVIGLAEQYLEIYRILLKVDPVLRLVVSSGETERLSSIEKDQSGSLSWSLRLNAPRHAESSDIRYSVVEFLVAILLSDLDLIGGDMLNELKGRAATRITLAFDSLLPDLDSFAGDE